MAAEALPLESRRSWRAHTHVEDFGSTSFLAAEEEEPYQHRHDGVTRATKKEFTIQTSTVSMDVEPPSTTSGVLRFLRLMSHNFLYLVVALFLASLVSSLVTNHCGLGLRWHDAVIPFAIVFSVLLYSACLAFFQVEVYSKMKEATDGLMRQKEQLMPQVLPTNLRETQDQSDHKTVPEMGDLAFFMGCLRSQRSLFFQARAGPPPPYSALAKEGSGYYFLPTRMQSTSHFQLMQNYYRKYLDIAGSCGCAQVFTTVVGLVQVWEAAANAVLPGVLRGCRGAEPSDGMLPGLVHQAFLSCVVLLALGAVQFRNVRWLMKNALGTATGEKEWLAYDLLQGDQKESSFLSSLDTAEDGFHAVDRDARGARSAHLQVVRHKYKGHLNLTYAWMCAAGAAESFGATYLAEMCDHIAAQTKEMVESSSNYKFKLKQMAEWDIKKAGIICRLVQAFLLVQTSVELLGTPSPWSPGQGPPVLRVWALATLGIVLGCCTASWKALLAAKYWRSQDVELAGRQGEVSTTICCATVVAALTYLCGVFGLVLRYVSCYHGGFSLVRSVWRGQLQCSAPADLGS